MHGLHSFFSHTPFLILFITIALGYWIGKFRVKTFVLGGVAGSLIIGVIIGQLDIPIPEAVGNIFFALFIYAVGYQGGPQFFRSLNRHTLVQLISATLTCVIGLLCVIFAAWWYHLDRGTAAGLAAGGLTQSAMIGTASSAIAKLGLSSALTKKLQANVAVGYAVCYIFGSFGPILMLTAIFPGLMKWNIRDEAKKLAASLSTSNAPILEPGQFNALPDLTTRAYTIAADSALINLNLGEIFDRYQLAIAGIVRHGTPAPLTVDTHLQSGDLIAVTARLENLLHHQSLLSEEKIKPADLNITEETRSLILSNKQFDGKTIAECFKATATQAHYGIFIRSVSRLGEKLKAHADLKLKRGDEIEVTGKAKFINSFIEKFGKGINAAKLTDYISFGFGMTLGVLIGLITVHFFDIAVSIGTGGGCLFSGLIMGWLHSRYPALGSLPTGASNFLRDFGLAVFVATVGITAGPQAVDTIKQYGLLLFFLGVGVTLVPQILTFYISYYLLKIKNPIVLLATIAGGRSANPGFAALLDKAGNSTPVVPFTATYAIANIWLTLWGPIVVGLITLN